MRKINIESYKVNVFDENGEQKEIEYNVRESIVNLLLSPFMKHTGVTLLQYNKLADKVYDEKESVVSLEEAEYDKIVDAVEKYPGFCRNDVEFVNRIMNAKIEVPITKGE